MHRQRGRRRQRRNGFSLVEMLATVAALVIVLGLMVSLARYVRRQASDQLTKQLLAQLDVLVQRYHARYHVAPAVPAFVPVASAPPSTSTTAAKTTATALSSALAMAIAPSDEALPEEKVLQERAVANNRGFIAAMRIEARRYPAEFAGLPQAFFADPILPDAWGTPLVFMAGLHPAVGMAMENRPFFLSAGPDRQFATLEDNLYSYEVSTEEPALPASNAGR